MAAVRDQHLIADPHLAQQRPVAGEDPAVGDVFVGRAGELRRVGVEQQPFVAAVVEAGRAGAAAGDAAQQARADAGFAGIGDDVAVPAEQALAVFEPAQFLHRRHRDVRIRADAPAAVGVAELAHREQAVAEVGFRRRAQRDHRAAARDAGDLAVVEVGRVHQRPAFADVRVRQQPFDRARAAQRERILHLADLLGDVDVHRRIRR